MPDELQKSIREKGGFYHFDDQGVLTFYSYVKDHPVFVESENKVILSPKLTENFDKEWMVKGLVEKNNEKAKQYFLRKLIEIYIIEKGIDANDKTNSFILDSVEGKQKHLRMSFYLKDQQFINDSNLRPERFTYAFELAHWDIGE